MGRQQLSAGPSRRDLEHSLQAAADPQRAAGMALFFKTAEGEYGYGDRFLGIPVPLQRKLALQHAHLKLTEIAVLLASRIHEHRFCALEILVFRYERGSSEEREQIVRFYLENTAGINNWDLVDTSAPYILGVHLRNRSREELDRLACSSSLWERRIAIVATLGLMRDGQIADTFRIARLLLSDKHDLIHKAIGWMLREAGKVSESDLMRFLKSNYPNLPRTTLRYAIERFPPAVRKQMLAGSFPSPK